jgi:hypothetical protein
MRTPGDAEAQAFSSRRPTTPTRPFGHIEKPELRARRPGRFVVGSCEPLTHQRAQESDMDSRGLRLALAGAALAAGTLAAVGVAAPAAAAVSYDPGTKSGFAGRADVQRAFGWTDTELARYASGVSFEQDFWTDDTYSVACGPRTFPVVHHREFGRFELIDTVVRRGGHRTATGYAGTLTGFRITGARSGISGTSVAPAIGQPCPQAGPPITAVRLVSTTVGWGLTVRSGRRSHELLRQATR